jgi:hypothetical protein
MMVEWFITNLTNCSLTLFLLSGLLSFAVDAISRRPLSIEQAVVRGLSMSTAPTGLAFVICAFNPKLVSQIEGGQLSFMLAGCIFIFISVKYGLPSKAS